MQPNPKEPSPAVKWFLTRKLKNLEWIKELPEEELDRRLASLNPRPVFHTAPFKHQKAMFLLGVETRQLFILADLGSGKTATALNLIAYFKLVGWVKRALVVVPDQQNIINWMEQVAEHTPKLKAVSVFGSRRERLEMLMMPADIYCINYAGLNAILDEKVGIRNRVILPSKVVAFSKGFEFMVLDESTAVKNSESVIFRICNIMAGQIPNRFPMSGRPFGRDALDLWAQFYLTDRGETLGKNIYIFRNSYFSPTKTPWAVKWKFNKELEEQLNTTIKNKSITYTDKELGRQTNPTRNIIKVGLSEEALDYYRKVSGDLIAERSDIWAAQIKNHYIKLRQICSGFLRFKSPEDEDEIEVIKFECPKEDALEQLVLLLPEGCKMIVYHEFTATGQRIVDLLKRLKIGHRWLYGAATGREELLSSFKLDPKTRVLVSNSKSGSFGLNLQVANYMVFYEGPADPIIRAQAEKRIDRTGQMKTCHYYDIVVQDSVEEGILTFIKEGNSLFRALVQRKITPSEVVGKLGLSSENHTYQS